MSEFQYDDPAEADVYGYDEQTINDAIAQGVREGLQQQSGQLQSQNAELLGYLAYQQDMERAAATGRATEEASKSLLAKYGGAWENDAPAIANLIAARPELLPPQALGSPQEIEHHLEAAYKLAQIETKQEADRMQKVDTDAFGDRLIQAHQKSWSAFRAANEDGKSVHDLLSE